MKQEIQNLKEARLALYRSFFDTLIERLEAQGFVASRRYFVAKSLTPTANPLALQEPETFIPETVHRSMMYFAYEGHEVFITLTGSSYLSAGVRVWSSLSQWTKRHYKEYYAADWEKGLYSHYKQATRKVHGTDLADLIKKIKKLIASGNKYKDLRDKEVAAGRGKNVI